MYAHYGLTKDGYRILVATEVLAEGVNGHSPNQEVKCFSVLNRLRSNLTVRSIGST